MKLQEFIKTLKNNVSINLIINSSKENIYITDNNTGKIEIIPKKGLINLFNNPAVKMIFKVLN